MKKWLYDKFFHYIIKNDNRRRKVFMWCYGLGEEDMIDDITSTNCL